MAAECHLDGRTSLDIAISPSLQQPQVCALKLVRRRRTRTRSATDWFDSDHVPRILNYQEWELTWVVAPQVGP